MNTMFIALGIMAFCLYVLYDIDSVKKINSFFHSFFAIGSVLLAVSTVGIIACGYENAHPNISRLIVFGIPACIFICILIYTLFFALPFNDIYVNKEEGISRVCKSGMYALCRHPGVLWLSGFYIFVGLAIPDPVTISGCITFTILNILYVVLQDKWTFLHTFTDYNLYKKEVPFLLPTRNSILSGYKTRKGH